MICYNRGVKRVCKVDGCKKEAKASKGMCWGHYQKLLKYGDPNVQKVAKGGLRKKYPIESRTLADLVHRCTNPNNSFYADYGGRGIKVCQRWCGPEGFSNFIKDMGTRPSRGYSIDRIDPNGDYCPENCRWADWYSQAANKRIYKNRTLPIGVAPTKSGKYCARFYVGKKQYYKTFSTLEEAVAYRRFLEDKYRHHR